MVARTNRDLVPNQLLAPTTQERSVVLQEDIVIVKSKMDDQGWWEGESTSTGKRGMFPNNFVEIIPDGALPSTIAFLSRQPY